MLKGIQTLRMQQQNFYVLIFDDSVYSSMFDEELQPTEHRGHQPAEVDTGQSAVCCPGGLLALF